MRTLLPTPLGAVIVAFADTGALEWLSFADQNQNEKVEKQPISYSPIQKLDKQLTEYFAGTRKTFDIPLNPGGTKFQQQVWKTLLTIPYGTTISYRDLTNKCGFLPTAIRAVGGANGSNPISIIIPCHRVIGSDGSMTGYGGGLERKQKLLELEGVLLSL